MTKEVSIEDRTKSGRGIEMSSESWDGNRWSSGRVNVRIGGWFHNKTFRHEDPVPTTEEELRQYVKDNVLCHYVKNDSGWRKPRLTRFEKVARAYDVGLITSIPDDAEVPYNGDRFYIAIKNGSDMADGERIVRTPSHKILFARTLKSALATKRKLQRSLNKFVEKIKAVDPELVPAELPEYEIFQVKEVYL